MGKEVDGNDVGGGVLLAQLALELEERPGLAHPQVERAPVVVLEVVAGGAAAVAEHVVDVVLVLPAVLQIVDDDDGLLAHQLVEVVVEAEVFVTDGEHDDRVGFGEARCERQMPDELALGDTIGASVGVCVGEEELHGRVSGPV